MDEQLAKKFLDLMYAKVPEGEWVNLFCRDWTVTDLSKNNRKMAWGRVGQLELLVEEATELSKTCCVWFGVSTRKQRLPYGRGGVEDCNIMPALWADIDVQGPGHKSTSLPPTEADAMKLLEPFPPPSILVHSGGGFQPYWILEEPVKAEEIGMLLDDWAYTWQQNSADLGWSIDNVFNVDRVMRLPGTFNRKAEMVRPIPVTMEIPGRDE